MDAKHQKILQENLPELCKTLNPENLLAYLPCLSQATQQEIQAKQFSKSRYSAVMLLYDALTCYPRAWDQLMAALRSPDVKLEDLADKLDPKPGPEPTKSFPQSCNRSQRAKTASQPKSTNPTSRRASSDSGKCVYRGDTLWGDMNAGVRDVLMQLDHEPGPDKLVGEIGFTNKEYQDIKTHRKGDSFAIALIEEWNSRGPVTLGRLMTVIKNTGRLDVLRDLEKHTGFKLPDDTVDEKQTGFKHPGDKDGDEKMGENGIDKSGGDVKKGPGKQSMESGNSTTNFENAIMLEHKLSSVPKTSQNNNNETQNKVPQVLLYSVSPDQHRVKSDTSSKGDRERASGMRPDPNARLSVGRVNNMPLDRSLSVDLSAPVLTPSTATTSSSSITSSARCTAPSSVVMEQSRTPGPIAQTTSTRVQSIAQPDLSVMGEENGRRQMVHLSASTASSEAQIISQPGNGMVDEEEVGRQQIQQTNATAFKWGPFESDSSCVQNHQTIHQDPQMIHQNHQMIHQESQDQEEYQPVTRKTLPRLDRAHSHTQIGLSLHQGPQVEQSTINGNFVLEGPGNSEFVLECPSNTDFALEIPNPHDRVIVDQADLYPLHGEVSHDQAIYDGESLLTEDSMNNNSAAGSLSFPSATNCVSIVRVGRRDDGPIKVTDLTDVHNLDKMFAEQQPKVEVRSEETTPMDESLSSVDSYQSERSDSNISGHGHLSLVNITEFVANSTANSYTLIGAVDLPTSSNNVCHEKSSCLQSSSSTIQRTEFEDSSSVNFNQLKFTVELPSNSDMHDDKAASSLHSSGELTSILRKANKFLPELRAETANDDNEESTESVTSSGNWISLLSDTDLFGGPPGEDVQAAGYVANYQKVDDTHGALPEVLSRGPGSMDNSLNGDMNTTGHASSLDEGLKTLNGNKNMTDNGNSVQEVSSKGTGQLDNVLNSESITTTTRVNNCNDNDNSNAGTPGSLADIDRECANDNVGISVTRTGTNQSSSMLQTALDVVCRESEFPELNQIFAGASGLKAFFNSFR